MIWCSTGCPMGVGGAVSVLPAIAINNQKRVAERRASTEDRVLTMRAHYDTRLRCTPQHTSA